MLEWLKFFPDQKATWWPPPGLLLSGGVILGGMFLTYPMLMRAAASEYSRLSCRAASGADNSHRRRAVRTLRLAVRNADAAPWMAPSGLDSMRTLLSQPDPALVRTAVAFLARANYPPAAPELESLARSVAPGPEWDRVRTAAAAAVRGMKSGATRS